ncbi:MAG: sigma-54-dependent Fis family transcriptional regulator [Myxococcales bacterium]|nr:sigma-54-dependent Fis family transcriptional regulator [Myxococcales bacterium]
MPRPLRDPRRAAPRRGRERGGPARSRDRRRNDVNPVVLVVDDEPGVRYTLRAILEDQGWTVEEAADGLEALDRIRRGGVDLVLTDLRMPRLDGMQLLAELSSLPAAPRAVVITAHGSERHAVEAMKHGALDYFAKPFDADEIVRVVRRSIEQLRLADENRRLRARLALGRTMVFESPAMARVAELVERVAGRDVTVLLTGESGTGKELVARAIVRASPRAERPYVRFNCAALPRELAEAELFGHARGAFTGAVRSRAGLFREADGGTLLLDEIGELDPATQGALLRVLQEREVRPVGEDRPVRVDVRVLAATHHDLARDVEAGRFRKDLFYRLDVVSIRVPPLRERPEDIAPLAEHFARRFGDRFGLEAPRLSPRVLDRLRRHDWPGNVRELEHVVERLVALAAGPEIDDDPFAGDAAADPTVGPGLRERVAAFERGLVAEAMARCQGNQSEAARQLGISRVTLIDKLKRHGLR